MRKVKQVISAILIGILLVGMTGCGKNVHQGGEGTNFPYTWKEERKGTILIKLDGSYGSETYHWSAVSTDETILKVEVAKKEKKGKISYRLTPLAEGSAQVIFTRERSVHENTAAEGMDDVAGTGAGSVSDSTISGNETGTGSIIEEVLPETENISEDASFFEEGGAEEKNIPDEEPIDLSPEELAELEAASAMVDEAYEAYLDQYRAKDVLGEISLQIDSVPSGRNGKLKLSVAFIKEQEHPGILQSEDQSFGYQVWEDSRGMLQVKLPVLETPWSASWEGEYITEEDPGIPGLTISRPEMENGRYIILRILEDGIVEGGQCFTVQGLEQGTATLEFSNPETEGRLVVDIEISANGTISVLSHRLEGME